VATSVSTFYSLRGQHWLARGREAENRALERLSSGRRINRGSDDPSGLIAATRLESAIRALEAESSVVARLDSNAAIADGHLSQLSTMIGDLRGLLVRSSNAGALSEGELAAHQMEVDSLVQSIQRFAGDAGTALEGLSLSGGGEALASKLREAAGALSSLASGGANQLSSGRFEEASAVVGAALSAFGEARGAVGSFQKNDLAPRADSLRVQIENLSDAESRIRDADFAEEISNLHRARVLSGASIEVLRISNRSAETVLALLR
jgi:flagellin